MKILMLTPYLPYPPASGGQIRTLYLLKYLAQNHSITLVSLYKDEKEKQYAQYLQSYCKEIDLCKRAKKPWQPRNIAKALFSTLPFLIVRNYSEEAAETIQILLSTKKFDVIHAETFYIMPHIPQTDIPVFLVEQTIEYKVYQHFVSQLPFIIRPFFYFDIIKLKHWEQAFWKKADLVGAVSKDDGKKMHDLLPDLKTTVIPNAAGEDLIKVYNRYQRAAKPIYLYQGNFSWLQNIEAAKILIDKIFPLIKARVPTATCIIAGQRAREKLGNIISPGVEIVDIPASNVEPVMQVYKRASIFLAPIEGPGGTRLKILGAMAAGLPVISSPTGISGLDVHH